jgi:hypothetical protein
MVAQLKQLCFQAKLTANSVIKICSFIHLHISHLLQNKFSTTPLQLYQLPQHLSSHSVFKENFVGIQQVIGGIVDELLEGGSPPGPSILTAPKGLPL